MKEKQNCSDCGIEKGIKFDKYDNLKTAVPLNFFKHKDKYYCGACLMKITNPEV